MADTLKNITLPAGQWVEIYAAVESQNPGAIAAGSKIVVQSVGNTEVRLSTLPAEPVTGDGFDLMLRAEQWENEGGSPTEYALSQGAQGSISVKLA